LNPQGGGFQTSADRAGTFTELLSSGRANVLRDKDLLKKLVAYEDFLQRFAVAGEYHIDLILGALNVFNRGFELSVDKPLINDTLQLNLLGTPPVASYDFNALASDKEFRNAAEQLWFVQSFYTLWRMRIMSRVEEIQQQLGKHLNDAPVRE
jgi:hypothetical protein